MDKELDTVRVIFAIGVAHCMDGNCAKKVSAVKCLPIPDEMTYRTVIGSSG